MPLKSLDQSVAAGAAILTRRGIAIPVSVSTSSGLIACWYLYQLQGGVMVSRCSDGRESNCPLPFERVLVSGATAQMCREAEAARQEAAQYVVRASGRVNNGRAYGWRSVRGGQR